MKSWEYYYLAKRNYLSDAEQRLRIKGDLKPGYRVHISAVCGKAMASVACLLKEYGCEVTGSDEKFSPPMGDVLANHGIKCIAPSIDNLDNIDVLIVGNTLSPSALEVEEARKRKIPMLSGAEVMGEMFKGKRALIVAGTHGKTTTSGLLTHVFSEAKREPAFMIGGAFQKTNESYSMGGRETNFVIYEGDEYNAACFDRGPKFLHYNPTSAIITSIEQDHVDLYTSLEDYKQAFQFLAEELPENGHLVIHESTLPYLDLQPVKARVVVYGASGKANAQYKIDKTNEEATFFSFASEDLGQIADISIPLFGEYNVANATAVITLSLLEGLSEGDVKSGLASFIGTRERQELLGVRKDGVILIRDYAHHPTAVTVTLAGIRSRYPDRRLVSIFEPLSASSRRRVFEDRYGEAFTGSDVSIIIEAPIKPGENKETLLNAENVKKIIESLGKEAHVVSTALESFQVLSSLFKPNDVVIFMSSGDLSGTPAKFLNL